jgi:hypothetical protein
MTEQAVRANEFELESRTVTLSFLHLRESGDA